MCRNIKPLYNFDPPVTHDEIHNASLQFVRKVTGFHHPSRANEEAFAAAVEKIASVTHDLLRGLVTTAPHRNREEEAARARAKAAQRYARFREQPS